ncbi:MAG: DUF433 domain-containing protein [Nitrospira sp.]|nr:DUF433 domain-containing protein [Nitrospira sp.]
MKETVISYYHGPVGHGTNPLIWGIRVTVGATVGLPASGKVIEEVLAAYPYIK